MSAALATLAGILLLAQSPADPPRESREESRARRRTPVVEVVERAGPAVVNIATEIVSGRNPFGQTYGPGDELWQQFFGGRRSQRQQSLGSGVIIDASGLVLTNEHVISRATNITITLSDRRTFECDVVGADPAFDLAVLKVRSAVDLPVVALGASDDLMPGETVVAIGNPFGLSNTVTTGVVSALHRSVEVSSRIYEDFIQTDAAINPGNSGGALLDIEGRLIGINTAIYNSANGIGFAIPIDKARAVVEEVLRYGEVRPAHLGLMVDPGSERGALVRSVVPQSPAAEAGIQPGDLIVDVGGQEVRSGRALRQIERGLIPGQRVRLTLLRGSGAAQGGGDGRGRLAVTVAVRELQRKAAAAMGQGRLGLQVAARGGRLVITGVDRRANAARVGIQSGDLLLSMGGRRVSTVEEFDEVCAAIYDADSIPVVVGRGGRAYYVHLGLSPLGTAL